LGTKAESVLKPIRINDLSRDEAILAVENAGTAAGQARHAAR
jgi:hypothetical protein